MDADAPATVEVEPEQAGLAGCLTAASDPALVGVADLAGGNLSLALRPGVHGSGGAGHRPRLPAPQPPPPPAPGARAALRISHLGCADCGVSAGCACAATAVAALALPERALQPVGVAAARGLLSAPVTAGLSEARIMESNPPPGTAQQPDRHGARRG